MIIYAATKTEFTSDVFANQIEQKIMAAFEQRANRKPPPAEIESWRNSMQYMSNVLLAAQVPDDAGVAIEYGIPLTSKRIDFILTGQNAKQQDTAVIVELKQWSKVTKTHKDGVVSTFVGGGHREQAHPSYQAWTYAALIQDFNQTVQEEHIQLAPCAYLHNCLADQDLKDAFYQPHTDRAPVFVREDVEALQAFIQKHIRTGDRNRLLYRIDGGKLKPSKSLIDHLSSLLQGNREFQLIDDQKLVYETALDLAKKAQEKGRKQVLIIEGGPGTGKSVVAINLLVETTKRQWLSHYVSKNAAPRAVFESRLTGTFKKTHIGNLFKGSGAYTEAPINGMDVLIVDEAHRLNEKSGLYRNLGDNQIKEIIQSAKTAIFFIDENQQVTIHDIGSLEEIRKWAEQAGADVTEMTLASQFRCNGSDGYLAWVDDVLRIRETANTDLTGLGYDCRVFDDPNVMRQAIEDLNAQNAKSRLVAGYCWEWQSKKDPKAKDVVIEEHDFAMRWNLTEDGPLWLVKPDSVSEVGCIHTCQGLELEYVGVIIGPDLVIRNGQVVTDATKRAKQDRSVFGFKKLHEENPIEAELLADRIIKNTYRTLMTRGMKGCFLYASDQETRDYFRSRLVSTHSQGLESREPMLRVAEDPKTY